MYRKITVVLTAALMLLTSCRLKRSDVIGTWSDRGNELLYINADNTFRYTKFGIVKDGQVIIDTALPYLGGKWILDKNALRFTFTDDTKDIGGGCKHYQYMWTKGSKKTLSRLASCKTITNRFHQIHKIR